MPRILIQLFLIVSLTAFYGCGEVDETSSNPFAGTTPTAPIVDISNDDNQTKEGETPLLEDDNKEIVSEVEEPKQIVTEIPDNESKELIVIEKQEPIVIEEQEPIITVEDNTSLEDIIEDDNSRTTAKLTEQSGVFIDTLVTGLTVVQYNKDGEVLDTTESLAKTTAEDGTFSVLDGSVEIEFKIGSTLSVGRAKANLFSTADGKGSAETVVTIVDLFNTESIYDSRVRFVARVLLTLDSNPEIEGIQLPETLPAGFENMDNVDYSLQGSAAKNQLEELFGSDVDIVSDIDAEVHLKSSVIELEKTTTIKEAPFDVCPNGGLIKEYKVDFNKDRVYETYSTVHCDKTSQTEQTKTYQLSSDENSQSYDENCPNGGIRIHHKQYEINERAQVARLIADYNSYKCEAAYYTVSRKEAKPFDFYDGNGDGDFDDAETDCKTGGIKHLVQRYRSGDIKVGSPREELAHCNNDGIEDETITYTYLTLDDGNKYCKNGGIQDNYFKLEDGENSIDGKLATKTVYICNSQDDGFVHGEHFVEILEMETKDSNPESICPFGGLEYIHTADYDNNDNTEPTVFSDYVCIQVTPENSKRVDSIVVGTGTDLNNDDIVEWFQATGTGSCPYGGNIFNYKTFIGGELNEDETAVIGGTFHSEFNETRCLEGENILIIEVNATSDDENKDYRPIVFGIGSNSYGVDGHGTCEYQGGKIVTTKVTFNGYVNHTFASTICNSDEDMDFSSEKVMIDAYMVDSTTKCTDWTISHYRQLLSSETPNEKVLNYEQNETICEFVGEEVELTTIEQSVKTATNSPKNFASNLIINCDSDNDRKNGTIEIVGENSSISMISFNSELAEKFGLTTLIDGYSKIIYFNGETSNNNWQTLFRTIKIVSGKTGKFQLILTIGNANAQKVHLGTVSGSETIDGNLEEWGEISESGSKAIKTEELTSSGKTSIITTTGYSSKNEKALTFRDVATSTNSLANHESIGIGISSGQIYGKSVNIDENDKIVINFSQPVTNVEVALTGIGGHFIDYDYSIESTNFTTSKEFALYKKHLEAFDSYNNYLDNISEKVSLESEDNSLESEKDSAESEKNSAEALVQPALTAYNNATNIYNEAADFSEEQAEALKIKESTFKSYESINGAYLEKLSIFNSINDKFVTATTDLNNLIIKIDNSIKSANILNDSYSKIKSDYETITKEYQLEIGSVIEQDDETAINNIFAKFQSSYDKLRDEDSKIEESSEIPAEVKNPELNSYHSIFLNNLKTGQLANARIVWTTYYNGEMIETDNLYRDSSDIDGDNREATKIIRTTVPTTKIVFEITSDNGKGSNYAIKYLDAEYLNIGTCESEIFSKQYDVEIVPNLDVIVLDRQFTYPNAKRYALAKGFEILSEDEYLTVSSIDPKLNGAEYWSSSTVSTDYVNKDGEASQILTPIMVRVNEDGSTYIDKEQSESNYKFVAFKNVGSAKPVINYQVIKTGNSFIQQSLIEAQSTCNSLNKRVPTIEEAIETYFTNYGNVEIPAREYWTTTSAISIDLSTESDVENSGFTIIGEENVESSDTDTGLENTSTSANSNDNFAQMIRFSYGNEDFYVEKRMDNSFYKSVICVGNSSGETPMVKNIVGRVVDEHYKSVAESTIKFTSNQFGSSYEFTSNDEGNYLIATIPAGTYSVEYLKDGYISTSKVVRLYSDSISVETAVISEKTSYMGWAKPSSGNIIVTYEDDSKETTYINDSDGRFNIMIDVDKKVISVKHDDSEAEITNFDTQHNKFYATSDKGEIVLQKNVPVISKNLNNGCIDNLDIYNEAFDEGYCNMLNIQYEAKIEFSDDENQQPFWTYSVHNAGSKTQDSEIYIESFTIGLTDNTLKNLPSEVLDQTAKYKAITSLESGTQGLEVNYGGEDKIVDNVVFAMGKCPSAQLIYNDGVQTALTISFSNGDALSVYVPVPICKSEEIIVTGKVTDLDGEAVENAKVFINYINSGITEDVYTFTKDDGVFYMGVKRGLPLTINVVYTEEIDGIKVDKRFGENKIYSYEKLLNQNIVISGDKDMMQKDLTLNSSIKHTICVDEVVGGNIENALNGANILLVNGNKRFNISTNESGINPTTGCSSVYLPFGNYDVTVSKIGFDTKKLELNIGKDSLNSKIKITKIESESHIVTRKFYEAVGGSCYVGSSYIAKLIHVTSKNSSYEFNYDVQRDTGNEMLKSFTLDVNTTCIKDISQSGAIAEDKQSITWITNGGNLEFNSINSDEFVIEIEKVNAHFVTFDGFIIHTQIEAPVCKSVPEKTDTKVAKLETTILDSNDSPISRSLITLTQKDGNEPVARGYTGDDGKIVWDIDLSYSTNNGIYTLSASDSRYSSSTIEIELVADKTLEKSFVLFRTFIQGKTTNGYQDTLMDAYASYNEVKQEWSYRIANRLNQSPDLSHWVLDLDDTCLNSIEYENSFSDGAIFGQDKSTGNDNNSVLKWEGSVGERGKTFTFKLSENTDYRIGEVEIFFKAGSNSQVANEVGYKIQAPICE